MFLSSSDEISVYVGNRTDHAQDATDDILETEVVEKDVSYYPTKARDSRILSEQF